VAKVLKSKMKKKERNLNLKERSNEIYEKHTGKKTKSERKNSKKMKEQMHCY
jgi:hypothetical protein